MTNITTYHSKVKTYVRFYVNQLQAKSFGSTEDILNL